ncbi:MAG: MotA/TolQ/ExbB proton channel family protein [Azoarcus sp.]|jgi:biopolymer transport protein ExbB|nr:MotA/TolQ/ExbB proton channel family protein [Azoarcus sp.]
MSETTSGFAHFLAQTDAVGLAVFAALVVMSLISWYVIAWSLWRNLAIRKRGRDFLVEFRQVRLLADAERLRMRMGMSTPWVRLLGDALRARESLLKKRDTHFGEAAQDDFLNAALAHSVARETRVQENGMTALASIASTAPFVGLFGTVWGIFHALQNIAVTAQASLDKVAGPVGEALIMTACGLFVAIPALLAYNAFARLNRHLSGELERFAHTVSGLLLLGVAPIGGALGESPVLELPAAPMRPEWAKV